MADTEKPKTNWHLVVWPILAVWMVVSAYVFCSDWRESATLVLPIFMVVSAFLMQSTNDLLAAARGSGASEPYDST